MSLTEVFSLAIYLMYCDLYVTHYDAETNRIEGNVFRAEAHLMSPGLSNKRTGNCSAVSAIHVRKNASLAKTVIFLALAIGRFRNVPKIVQAL